MNKQHYTILVMLSIAGSLLGFLRKEYIAASILLALQLTSLISVKFKIRLFRVYEPVHHVLILGVLLRITDRNTASVMMYLQIMEFLYRESRQIIGYWISIVYLLVRLGIDDPTLIGFSVVGVICNLALQIVERKQEMHAKSPQTPAAEIMLSNQHPSAYRSKISYETINIDKDVRMELFNLFPEGIALISIVDEQSFNLDFVNDNMLKIFDTAESNLLSKLTRMQSVQLVEAGDQKSTAQQSLSSFHSFPTTQFPSHPYRKTARAQTNNQPTHREMLHRRSYKPPSDKVILSTDQLDHENLVWHELMAVHKLLERQDVLLFLRQSNQIQLHNIIIGKREDQNHKKRSIELKIYMSLIAGQPLILVVARDVTYRDYIANLQEYSKQKSQTLAFVSHEYRTPLNCIIEMLSQNFPEDQQTQTMIFSTENEIRSKQRSVFHNKPNSNRHLKIALDNARYLLSLSDDLLDLAQMKVGKFKLQRQRFNIINLINSCIDLFQLTAERSQIKLFLQAESDIPKFINSDQNRIRQILINLLGNAFKFTQEGSVIVKCTSQMKKLELAVCDTGSGISEEDQGRLFQAFGKGNSDESKKLNKHGVGLGLLISNQIVQNLNMDLQSGLKFKSTDKGSTFYFTIPINEPTDIESLKEQDSMLERNAESESEQNSVDRYVQQVYVSTVNMHKLEQKRQPRILIVDDTSTNIEILSFQLRALGYTNVDRSIGGHFAYQQCEKLIREGAQFYSLIFMDIEMPGVGGIQATKLIRQMAPKLDFVIIGCSAYEEQQQEAECLSVGMNEYLKKPVSKEALRILLAKYL